MLNFCPLAESELNWFLVLVPCLISLYIKICLHFSPQECHMDIETVCVFFSRL